MEAKCLVMEDCFGGMVVCFSSQHTFLVAVW